MEFNVGGGDVAMWAQRSAILNGNSIDAVHHDILAAK